MRTHHLWHENTPLKMSTADATGRADHGQEPQLIAIQQLLDAWAKGLQGRKAEAALRACFVHANRSHHSQSQSPEQSFEHQAPITLAAAASVPEGTSTPQATWQGTRPLVHALLAYTRGPAFHVAHCVSGGEALKKPSPATTQTGLDRQAKTQRSPAMTQTRQQGQHSLDGASQSQDGHNQGQTGTNHALAGSSQPANRAAGTNDAAATSGSAAASTAPVRAAGAAATSTALDTAAAAAARASGSAAAVVAAAPAVQTAARNPELVRHACVRFYEGYPVTSSQGASSKSSSTSSINSSQPSSTHADGTAVDDRPGHAQREDPEAGTDCGTSVLLIDLPSAAALRLLVVAYLGAKMARPEPAKPASTVQVAQQPNGPATAEPDQALVAACEAALLALLPTPEQVISEAAKHGHLGYQSVVRVTFPSSDAWHSWHRSREKVMAKAKAKAKQEQRAVQELLAARTVLATARSMVLGGPRAAAQVAYAHGHHTTEPEALASGVINSKPAPSAVSSASPVSATITSATITSADTTNTASTAPSLSVASGWAAHLHPAAVRLLLHVLPHHLQLHLRLVGQMMFGVGGTTAPDSVAGTTSNTFAAESACVCNVAGPKVGAVEDALERQQQQPVHRTELPAAAATASAAAATAAPRCTAVGHEHVGHQKGPASTPRLDTGPAVLVSVDLEWWERDQSVLLEIGWTVWDNVSHTTVSKHWIVEEGLRRKNGKYVPDNRFGFRFGQSTTGPLSAGVAALQADLDAGASGAWVAQAAATASATAATSATDTAVGSGTAVGATATVSASAANAATAAAASSTKSQVALVGHGMSGDLAVLARVGLVLPPGIQLIDTADVVWGLLGGSKKQAGMSLRTLLGWTGVQGVGGLHNGGNDARYTLEALLRLCHLPDNVAQPTQVPKARDLINSNTKPQPQSTGPSTTGSAKPHGPPPRPTTPQAPPPEMVWPALLPTTPSSPPNSPPPQPVWPARQPNKPSSPATSPPPQPAWPALQAPKAASSPTGTPPRPAGPSASPVKPQAAPPAPGGPRA